MSELNPIKEMAKDKIEKAIKKTISRIGNENAMEGIDFDRIAIAIGTEMEKEIKYKQEEKDGVMVDTQEIESQKLLSKPKLVYIVFIDGKPYKGLTLDEILEEE